MAGKPQTGSSCAASTTRPSPSTRWRTRRTTWSRTGTTTRPSEAQEEAQGRAKAKAKAAKAAKPAARMRIVWTVVNDAFKTVATFEYAQKEAAQARAAELTAKGKGTHFVQKVKEPMPDNAPGLGAAPRAESPPRPPPSPRRPSPRRRRGYGGRGRGRNRTSKTNDEEE